MHGEAWRSPALRPVATGVTVLGRLLAVTLGHGDWHLRVWFGYSSFPGATKPTTARTSLDLDTG